MTTTIELHLQCSPQTSISNLLDRVEQAALQDPLIERASAQTPRACIDDILSYFQHRNLKMPDFLPAIMFAQSEMGEVADAIMHTDMLGSGWKRNHTRETSLAEELADTYMMLELAVYALGDDDLPTLLRRKMAFKGWTPRKTP